MKCLTREQMEKFEDGGLSREESRAAEAHLAACPVCRALRAEIRDFDALLRSCAPPADRPAGTEPGCPGAETVAAFMDGSMPEGNERDRVAAHIAECPACAVRAADAAETVRLVSALERKGLDRPPRALAEAVRDRLCPKGPVWLGEFSASVADLLDRFASWAGAAAEGPACASIAESVSGYALPAGTLTRRMPPAMPTKREPARTRRKPRRGWNDDGSREAAPVVKPLAAPPGAALRWALAQSFSRGDLAVVVALAASRERLIECTVRLTDRGGNPLISVPVEMRKGTAMLRLEPTGPAGEAVFGDLVAGNYQFLIRRGGGARVGVTLN